MQNGTYNTERKCCGCDELAKYMGSDGELYCVRHIRMSGSAARERIVCVDGEMLMWEEFLQAVRDFNEALEEEDEEPVRTPRHIEDMDDALRSWLHSWAKVYGMQH
jgi:hypothetical protein